MNSGHYCIYLHGDLHLLCTFAGTHKFKVYRNNTEKSVLKLKYQRNPQDKGIHKKWSPSPEPGGNVSKNWL